MTPQERTRRSMLWHKVERLLFCPASAEDQRTWCYCFVRSLARYWEIEDFVVPGSVFPAASFSLPLPDFSLSYDLSGWGNDTLRSSVRMIFDRVAFACHDIDHDYDDRVSLSEPPPDRVLAQYQNLRTRRDELMTDIRWVLRQYLIHPRTHLHLIVEAFGRREPADENFREVVHEVRLGLGITNPFAALFQFRMNLVLLLTRDDTKAHKEAERNRIADLVHYTILNDDRVQAIPPGKLFDLT